MAAGEKLLRSLVAMAAADGHIDPRELELIDQYRAKWGVEPEALQRCIAEVEAGNAKVTLPQDAKSRKVFLKALVKVAAVDGVIEPGEQKLLRAVAKAMQVSDDDLEAMVQRALSKVGADSDDQTRVDSDPRLEAAPDAAPPAGPEGEPIAPEELFAYIAYKQSRGEPVPRELMELAALLHLSMQQGRPGGPHLSNTPLASKTPAWLQKLTTKQRIGVVAGVVALWLLIPTVTGLIAGANALSRAEDRAEFLMTPTPRQVETGRSNYKHETRAQQKRKETLDAELATLRVEAAKAKEAPERLQRFGRLRQQRWSEFERMFPKGPKQGEGRSPR